MGLGRGGTASLCVCVGVLASRCEVVGERRQAGRLTAGQTEKESVLLLFCNGGSQAPLSLLLRVDTPWLPTIMAGVDLARISLPYLCLA